MNVEAGIDAVLARAGRAAKVLVDQGATVAQEKQNLVGLGAQIALTRTLTPRQAEDAMARVLLILGTLEAENSTSVVPSPPVDIPTQVTA